MRVALLISDFDCEPEAIGAIIGVHPTEIFRKGALLGKGPRRVESHVWRLQSPVDTNDLEDHVVWILDRLPNDLSELSTCSTSWSVQLAVGIDIGSLDRPGASIGADHLRRLSNLHASIDIDLYCVD